MRSVHHHFSIRFDHQYSALLTASLVSRNDLLPLPSDENYRVSGMDDELAVDRPASATTLPANDLGTLT